MEIKSVGVIRTDSDDVATIYAAEKGGGCSDLFYDNDPYGVVSMYGFEGAKFADMSDVDGLQEYMINALDLGVKGSARGLVWLADKKHLLVIFETLPFIAEIQPTEMGSEDSTPYTASVDVTDLEADDPDMLIYGVTLGYGVEL